jgi:hypothetical protein
VTYGGDSGNRISVLYWRCPLIRVSVIRSSTLFLFNLRIKTLKSSRQHKFFCKTYCFELSYMCQEVL